MVVTGFLYGAESEFAFDPWQEGEGGIRCGDVEEGFDGMILRVDRGIAALRWGGGVCGNLAQRDILGQEDVSGGKNGGALEGVLKFADIAWPWIGFEHADGILGEFEWRAVFLVGDALQEILGEEANVLHTLAERGDVNADDVEAVEEILAERFFGNLVLEVLIGGADDPDIGMEGLVAAYAGEFTFLEDAKDFALDLEGHFADLVEEEGALVALLETADTLGSGSRECALLVPEEFALEQGFGDGGAVDCEKVFIAPGAVVVDRTSDEFLA